MTLVRVMRRCHVRRHRRTTVSTAALGMAAVGAAILGLAGAVPPSARADTPPRIVVAATPLAMMVADITKGVTRPQVLDLAKLANLSPEAMRNSLRGTGLLVWIGPFHLPRLVPVLKGQEMINDLALFDVRGVRLMGLPEPVKPGVKPDPPQIKIDAKKPVAQRGREISAQDLHHKYPDPYIWLDPRNGIAMVRAITVRLSALDPENGRQYRRNSAALVSQIEAMDQEFQVRVVPLRAVHFVVFDRSFQYLERQYDLEPKLRLHESNVPMTAQEAAVARQKLIAARLPCVIVPTTAAHGKAVTKGVATRVAWIDPYGRDLHRQTNYTAFLNSVADRITTCLTGRRPPTR